MKEKKEKKEKKNTSQLVMTSLLTYQAKKFLSFAPNKERRKERKKERNKERKKGKKRKGRKKETLLLRWVPRVVGGLKNLSQ